MKRTKYTKKDFLWTQWKPEDIKRVVNEAIAHKKKKYAEIKKIPAKDRTFENTIFAIESSDYETMDKINQIVLLMEVSPKSEVREVSKKALEKLNIKMVDIEFDEKIYQAVLEFQKTKEKLIGEDRKLFKDMLISYKRMGFGLSPLKRKELQKNYKKLSKLSGDFSKNINDYKDFILVSKDELDGLPKNYIKGLKKKGNKFVVSLDYPDLVPFMSNAKNSKKRKELADKNLQKGGKKNIKLLKEILILRDRSAKLLGYKNHVDFKTEVRLVKNSTQVFKFTNNLMSKLSKGVEKDLDELKELKKEIQPNEKTLQYYDIVYYSEKLQKKKFNIDSEKIREYFPLENVKKGVFKIYSQLFSVKFQKISNYPLWHKGVELYSVKNKQNKVISYFILDLYPREGKYGHAMASPVIYGRQDHEKRDKYVAPIACMVANFPTPNKKLPSLLSHDEVLTFFHEFGHLMHFVLTKAVYSSQSGYNVAWDFVEAPSQMFEYWVWNKKMLNILSRHYKTGKNLPKKMLDNMLKAKYHMVYYQKMRQLVQTLFDLNIHSKKIKETSGEYNKLVKKYVNIKMPKENIFPAGFGHLMGYDAGYYSYMWSEVYAADMFTRFQKEGLLNKKTGGDYKEWILEKGSSQEEMELIKMFLGRKPNNKAFLKEIGL